MQSCSVSLRASRVSIWAIEAAREAVRAIWGGFPWESLGKGVEALLELPKSLI